MTLKDYLKKWKQDGYSQKDFAHLIGIHYGTLQRYLNGSRIPETRIAAHIEETTQGQVKIQDLLPVENIEPTNDAEIERINHIAEIVFIKNFFDHKNWISQPAVFRMDNIKYIPDFYDGNRNVFIEVAGTRQAYHYNKAKYALFRKTYPLISFEIRFPSGEILDETGRIDWSALKMDNTGDK